MMMLAKYSDCISAVASVVNLLLVIYIFWKTNRFQLKLNEKNEAFQERMNLVSEQFQKEMYNKTFSAYWMHEIIYREFKIYLQNYEESVISLIESSTENISEEYTPIQKKFIEELKVFDIFSQELKEFIKGLLVDLEDYITDPGVTKKQRLMKIRKVRFEIINLIYRYDCQMHQIN